MDDRTRQAKSPLDIVFNEMTFSGELDMIQDQVSENIFKQTRSFPNTLDPHYASTNMPVVRNKTPSEDEEWIFRKGSSSGNTSRSTGPQTEGGYSRPATRGAYHAESLDYLPPSARDKPVARSMSADIPTNRDTYRLSSGHGPKNYRYTIAGYVDTGPTFAGDLDMRTNPHTPLTQGTSPYQKFVSRVPAMITNMIKAKHGHPIIDYVALWLNVYEPGERPQIKFHVSDSLTLVL